ncbi:hypothetical protein ASJ79_12750 [Mycobacterium sp. NAZ190054]|nr:hypothetical protein ASJ79_12750 [Mycobacterium sp. NAZ190054]
MVAALCAVLVSACGGGGGGGGDATTDAGGGAEGWQPGGTVEMVVGAQPGGGSDVMARTFVSAAEEMRDGLQMTVSNFDSVEAYTYVKGEAGNDDVLVTATYGNVILSPLSESLNYLWSDFTPLAMFATDPSFVVVRNDSEFQSMADVATAAKERDITMGVVTAAGVNTVHSAQIADALGIKLNNVVFESGGEELAAVLAGDVDAALMEPSEFVQQAEAGDVRAIMIMSPEPHPSEALSDVPTATDAGIQGDIVTQFRSFLGAPDMSPDATEYWVSLLEEWTTTDSYQQYVEENYLIPELVVGAELDERLQFLEDSARRALGE